MAPGMVEESQYLPIPLRPKPPELEFPPPDCSICGGPLECDDGWDCPVCLASWPYDGQRGRYEDYTGKVERPEVACLSTIEPYDNDRLAPEHESIRHLREQCVLPGGHDEDKHRCDFHTWGLGDPRIVHHSVEDAEYLGLDSLVPETLVKPA